MNPVETKAALQTVTARILALQTTDGAIPLGGSPDRPRRLVPYFANFGALGLVIAARIETDGVRTKTLLDSARRWTRWYDAHRNPDGTIFDYEGTTGAWKSTGKYDSTDSYASTYLELQAALGGNERDGSWLRERYRFVRLSVAAMGLTRQKNGLTTATPKWPVMYTMDNVEVLRGLRAASRIAGKVKQSSDAKTWTALADQTEAALSRDLWDPQNRCYLVGLQTDGGTMKGLQKWYPDVMANLMAVGWLPGSARNQSLYRKLAADFAPKPDSGIPASAQNEGGLERLVWWGFAARAAGDTARLQRIEGALVAADYKRLAITNPATLGHICRLLSPEWEVAK
jgi:hypothetical protein